MDSLVLVPLSLLVAVVVVSINLAAFAAFGIDKRRAETGDRRIREDTLLRLALLGGCPGAYAGRRLFRHKTRKQPFSDRLFTIAVLQIAAVAGAATWILTG